MTTQLRTTSSSHEFFLVVDGQFAASSEWSVHSPLPSCDSGGFSPSKRICCGAIACSTGWSQIPHIIWVALSLVVHIHSLGDSSRNSSNLAQSRSARLCGLIIDREKSFVEFGRLYFWIEPSSKVLLRSLVFQLVLVERICKSSSPLS